MFGDTPEEAIGRSVRMLILADRQSEEDEVLAPIRRGESVDDFETVRQRLAMEVLHHFARWFLPIKQ